MPNAILKWDFEDAATNAAGTIPTNVGTMKTADPLFSTLTPWKSFNNSLVSMYITTGGPAASINPEFPTPSTSARTVNSYSNRSFPDMGGGYYLYTQVNVPNGFTPIRFEVSATRSNTNNHGMNVGFSTDNYSNQFAISGASMLGSTTGNQSYIRNVRNPVNAGSVNGSVLEIRLAVFSTSYSTANRLLFDNILLEGSYPSAGPAWSMWNGTAEVPVSVQGVYDGSIVVPHSAIEIAP